MKIDQAAADPSGETGAGAERIHCAGWAVESPVSCESSLASVFPFKIPPSTMTNLPTQPWPRCCCSDELSPRCGHAGHAGSTTSSLGFEGPKGSRDLCWYLQAICTVRVGTDPAGHVTLVDSGTAYSVLVRRYMTGVFELGLVALESINEMGCDEPKSNAL